VDDQEVRRDLEATVAARRELGPSHDRELIDGFLERIDKRLEERRPRAVKPMDEEESRGMVFVMGLVSLGCGIPITAIALGHSLAAFVIAWVGIVLINLVFALSGRRR
jgi:hypothetical protein